MFAWLLYLTGRRLGRDSVCAWPSGRGGQRAVSLDYREERARTFWALSLHVFIRDESVRGKTINHRTSEQRSEMRPFHFSREETKVWRGRRRPWSHFLLVFIKSPGCCSGVLPAFPPYLMIGAPGDTRPHQWPPPLLPLSQAARTGRSKDQITSARVSAGG